MEMQRRSVEGSLGLCKVLGDFVPMGFRASVCIYLLNTNCLQDGKRIGVPSVVVLGILGGVLDVRANGAGVGQNLRLASSPTPAPFARTSNTPPRIPRTTTEGTPILLPSCKQFVFNK